VSAQIVKYIAGVLIIIVLLIGYFINKNNKEDMARLKMAEIQQNTRLMQNKIDEVQAQRESEARIKAKALEKSVKERQEAYIYEAQQYSSNESYHDMSKQTKNESIPNRYSEQEWKDICRSASLTARTVMYNRQRGHSMSDQFDALLPNSEPQIRSSIENMIKLAYGRTRYSTPESMKRAELEFENEYHLICLRSYT
jgi:hypothetical protein